MLPYVYEIPYKKGVKTPTNNAKNFLALLTVFPLVQVFKHIVPP